MQDELNQLDSHSLEVLEFPKILALAARKAQSVPGAEAIVRLQFFSQPESVRRELNWTSELRNALSSTSDIPSINFPDVRAPLEKIRVDGSLLEARELFELGQFMALASGVLKFFKTCRTTCPLSWELVQDITIDEELNRRISRSVDPSGEVLDEASPALKTLRREIEKNREKARELLTSFLEAMGTPAESFTTIRNDRYMVLIPTDARRRQKGIVHDQSASGAGIYFEPLQAVDVNNELSRLRAEEKDEILRILRELSSGVRAHGSELRHALSALTKLDQVFARARFSAELSSVCPAISTNGTLRFRGARHPLLLLQGREKGFEVCPLDLEMGDRYRILLISGPNMGGKTVALKTLGLLVLMMKAGFHVPGLEGTEIPVFDRVFCDIGDEQSIEDQLSTFAAHMKQVATAIETSSAESLVLIDELGAGTDPVEGAALAKSVLEELVERGGLSVATTHLGSLKNFVASGKGMRNASMAFDPQTEEPLYKLEVGVPGQSRAIETAARMGIAGRVIERAKALLTKDDVETGKLLAELEVLRREAEKERDILKSGTQRVSGLLAEYESRLSRLESERKELRARAAREARGLLNEAMTLVRSAKESLKSRDVKREELARLTRDVEAADEKMALEEKEAVAVPEVKPVDIQPGIKVWASDIGSTVTVVSQPDEEGRVRVERKGVRIETHVSRLGKPPEEGEARERPVVVKPTGEEAFSASLDLRGLMADEALDSLDKYLDGAVLRGFSQVMIIHGKGKGILREKVQEALTTYPFVRNFRLGEINEGGTGVTVVELAT